MPRRNFDGVRNIFSIFVWPFVFLFVILHYHILLTNNEQYEKEATSFIIHAADISNPTKPLEIYKEWAQRCVDEFFKQGDLEKNQGIPISFNCDRNTVSLSQSQLGFIDVIVSPLFTVLNEYFPQLSFTLENIKTNYNYYKGVKDEEKKDKDKEK